MASHRYSLRSRSKSPSLERKSHGKSTVSCKAPRPAKSDPPHTEETLPSTSNTSPDTSLLFQSPRKWTLDNLRAANAQIETDLPFERIVASKYIPSHDDPEFRSIAASFQDPTVEDTPYFLVSELMGDRQNNFFWFFNDLRRYKMFGRLFSPYEGVDLMMAVLKKIHPNRLLLTKPVSRIPLSIAALKANKGVWVDATVLRYCKENDTMGIPLAVISRKQEVGDLGIAKYEIPQLLLQANMIFNYNETFEKYEAFVISLEGYTYTFVKAVMTPEYLKSIRAGKPACGHLKILRSNPFDVTDRNIRLKFLGGVMALSRYFVQRPEFSFPMRKFHPVG